MGLPDADEIREITFIFSICFVLLGLFTGLGTFFQTFFFNIAGVKLTTRLRTTVFEATMKQEMAWFDDTKNGVGNLCARLAGDCSSVQGVCDIFFFISRMNFNGSFSIQACGTRLASILQSLSTVVIAIGISLYSSWELTAIAFISVPIVLAACYYESKYT